RKEHVFFLEQKRNNEIILHRRDNIAHEVLPQKPKPSEKHSREYGLTCTYRHDYNSYTLSQPPVFTRKPYAYLPPLEKMDLHTTTWTSWKHPNEKPVKMCQALPQFNETTEPFNSTSTVKEDYKP
ncbi:hypothetical protein Nmel_008273, partial [Mimus melanotis]